MEKLKELVVRKVDFGSCYNDGESILMELYAFPRRAWERGGEKSKTAVSRSHAPAWECIAIQGANNGQK